MSLNVRQEAYEPFVPMKVAGQESPPAASERIADSEQHENHVR
jgi:hypothetical protein